MIFNSRNEDVAPALAAYGIDAAYLDRGQVLYEETMQLMDLQKKEYQEERAAFDRFFTEKDEVEKTLQKTRDLARALSKRDPDLQSRLKFSPLSDLPTGDWIQAGVAFYNSLLNETAFLEKLAEYNVTTDQLDAERQNLENLRQVASESMTEKGQAQEATQQRNQKLEELEDYCQVLKTVASIALEDRPQLMESLGVLVRS